MAANNPANSSAGSDDGCLTSIQAKLSKLSSNTPNYGTVCIYKVPDKHRNKNQEAYTPKLVSIGFVHHGQNQLQAMEEYKLRYLNDFVNTFQVSLEELVDFAKGEEQRVRGCYEDNCVSSLSEKHKTPSEVILLDGVFVIELFLKNHFVELRENGDRMFDNSWVSNEILHDLLLFENQLPLKFLHKLYADFVLKKLGTWLDNMSTIHPPSLYELAHKYFKDVGTGKLALTSDFEPARHFLEFLSIMHKPDNKQNSRDVLLQQSSLSPNWCGRLYGSCLTCIDNKQNSRGVVAESRLDFAKCPSAIELKAAGVNFKEGNRKSLLNVQFDTKKGVLEIPTLTVSDSTETFFHNLIAFERSEYNVKHITSSVVLLGNLIKTHKDVDFLIQNHIIVNELGSSEKVALLFSNLYEDLVVAREVFLYAETCYQLNHYTRDQFHQLKAKYATTPLIQAAGVAALVTIILTLVSTACSVLQVLGIGSLK